MARVRPLPGASLLRRCRLQTLKFKTTDDLDGSDALVGQDRALEAVRFGMSVRRHGYNVFAHGAAGTGKFTFVAETLAEEARTQAVPADWCYVYNFDQPDRPVAISLPAGDGVRLDRDMRRLVDELGVSLPEAFQDDETRARFDEIEEEYRQRRSTSLDELRAEAEDQGVALLETPAGFTFAPRTRAGTVMSAEQFNLLADDERRRIERTVIALQEKLQRILREFQTWRQESRDRYKTLQREIAAFEVGHLIDGIREGYRSLPQVGTYLDAVQNDLLEHVNELLAPAQANVLPFAQPPDTSAFLRRYTVNLLVDNSGLDGAPVVIEDLPNHDNLIGRIEHVARMGALFTDFTLLKPGALHRANGGYLVLDAHKVLMQPLAWETLKRALGTRQVRIESIERALSLVSTTTLEPEPIPLDVKVFLVGDRRLCYLLQAFDPEFDDLFKVVADFGSDVDREDDPMSYARLIASVARRGGNMALNRRAVARMIEHGARLTGDSDKVSVHLRSLADLLSEADHFAREAGRDVIDRDDVQAAIDAQVHRADRLRERIYEAIERGVVHIDTGGGVVGQINGLSVLSIGGFAFGQPSRITATTRIGDGKVVDIEREARLGGKLHSKGVLILSSFLQSRYAREHPVSFGASLVFEQSYGGVDGDSASLAELCALLSSLSGLPIEQSLAVTGSVDQTGRVQAIGGVNEKIEGFFDVCTARGLDGSHGVLIPASNVANLMLREDVVAAARSGEFRVYPVTTVDEALHLLTGVAPGERGVSGRFPSRSVNRLVEERLVELARLRRERGGRKGRSGNGNENGNGNDA